MPPPPAPRRRPLVRRPQVRRPPRARRLSGAVGTSFQDEFTLPDVDSRTGFDILEEDFGGQGAGISGTIVFRAELVMGVSFVQGLAVGAAIVVAVTVVASLTLLPALLGFAGERVEVTRWRGLIAASLVAIALVGLGLGVSPLLVGLPLAVVVLAASFAVTPLRRDVPRRAAKPLQETLACRWSRLIQCRPWPAAPGGALLLVVLALPVLGLGFADEGNDAEITTTRKAYDLLADGFGRGFNGLA